jgi:CTD kinase subunit gamma
VSGEDDHEFEKLWEEGSDIGDDDFIAAEEDAAERRQAVEYG